MTTAKQRFDDVINFRCPGRTLVSLGGIWPSTLERWRAEGMPAQVTTVGDLVELFRLHPHIWGAPQAELFIYPQFPRSVVAETEETITYRNGYGIVCTDFKVDAYKSMPHFESFPVQNRQDWGKIRDRLQWHPDRVGETWRQQVDSYRLSDTPVILALGRAGSFYGALRDLVGMEGLSLMFYDEPDLIEAMMDTLLELDLKLVDALFDTYVPDAVCLWEDMAYNHGSLLGIHHVRDLMAPRCRALTDRLRANGVATILLDSDGRIDELIPVWLECGVDGFVPMEAQAGMDVAAYRDRYPNMLMMGGIDKKALAAGRSAIDAEVEKVRKAIASGGYIPFFDHGLPHDVRWDDFVYFVEQMKAFR